MITKEYIELQEKFIELVAEQHNLYVKFIHKENKQSIRDLIENNLNIIVMLNLIRAQYNDIRHELNKEDNDFLKKKERKIPNAIETKHRKEN